VSACFKSRSRNTRTAIAAAPRSEVQAADASAAGAKIGSFLVYAPSVARTA